ncbi:MAG: gamma-glutamyl-gamma-aminobutyrate hydrolase family protein [Pseudomonadota bacterium]
MRIHSLQHVAFEDTGSIYQDLIAQGHSLTTTHWYLGEQAPELNEFDVLIIMGGPMGVYDEDKYPWLAAEKTFISASIAAGKKILGICLGAQLIACVLGAKVTQNIHREIGWFPITINAAAHKNPIASILANCAEVFHWHGDTFALPEGATLLASSAACVNQVYVIDEQIYAFQFHLETTRASAIALIENCAEDLDNSNYVQTAEKILRDTDKFTAINQTMSRVLEKILR